MALNVHIFVYQIRLRLAVTNTLAYGIEKVLIFKFQLYQNDTWQNDFHLDDIQRNDSQWNNIAQNDIQRIKSEANGIHQNDFKLNAIQYNDTR
jgi:hypothetical protein